VRAAVGNGERFGVSVDYVEDGPTLLGTGGALRAALQRLAPTFLVTYGDSYLPFDYAEPLHILEGRPDADGVMAVFRNEGQWDTSNTSLRWDDAGEPWVARYQKTRRGDPDAALFDYIDYGAMALRREIIARIPAQTAWGLDRVQAELASRGRLRGCVAHARFFEIGSEEGLAELERHLSQRGAPP
jgi:NDP-sugar pyrophosphorylase family protein